VALTDQKLGDPGVGHHEEKVSTAPHVKVDDFTTTDWIGRTYFAIDRACKYFIVNHIGLHNYQ